MGTRNLVIPADTVTKVTDVTVSTFYHRDGGTVVTYESATAPTAEVIQSQYNGFTSVNERRQVTLNAGESLWSYSKSAAAFSVDEVI